MPKKILVKAADWGPHGEDGNAVTARDDMNHDRELPISSPQDRSNTCWLLLKWPQKHIVPCPSRFPLPLALYTPSNSPNNIQPMSLNFIHYHASLSEVTDPTRDDPGPCYRPPLQLTDSPSPELFDQECDNDEEVSGFRCSADQINTLFNSARDTNPAISTRISTLSAFTDSTDSSYEIASSQYSFDFPSSESDYFNPSESEFESHCSVKSERQLFNSPVEFTDPLPYIPPLNTAEAHGTMHLEPNFLADRYPTAMQQLESVTCVNPAVLSAHVISDAIAPVQRPLESPHSPFRKPEPMCIGN